MDDNNNNNLDFFIDYSDNQNNHNNYNVNNYNNNVDYNNNNNNNYNSYNNYNNFSANINNNNTNYNANSYNTNYSTNNNNAINNQYNQQMLQQQILLQQQYNHQQQQYSQHQQHPQYQQVSYNQQIQQPLSKTPYQQQHVQQHVQQQSTQQPTTTTTTTTTSSNNNGTSQIPFGWLSNSTQFSDFSHEIPFPVYRADSSINLIDPKCFTNTVTVLHANRQQDPQLYQNTSPIRDQNNNGASPNPKIPLKNPKQLISTISHMIQNTNVSNIKMRSDIPKPQTDPSPLLRSIYSQLPILKEVDRRILSPIIIKNNTTSNTTNTTSTSTTSKTPSSTDKLNYLNNLNATDIGNKENNHNTVIKFDVKSINEQQQLIEQQNKLKRQQEKQEKKDLKKQQRREEKKLQKKQLQQEQQEQQQKQLEQQQQIEEEKPIQKLFNLVLKYFDTAKQQQTSVINSKFLEDIGKEIQACSKMGLLQDVSLEKCTKLTKILVRFAQEPSSVSLSFDEKDAHFENQFKRVEFALECSLLALNLLMMPDISEQLSTILLEDQLFEILTCLKYQVFENVIGHLDPSFKTHKPEKKSPEKKSKKRTKVQKDDDDEDDDQEEDDENSEDEYSSEDENPYDKKSSSSKKKSTTTTTNSSINKSKLTKFTILSNKLSEILERISWMIENSTSIRLTDQCVTLLLDMCIPTLFIEGINFIQLGSIGVIRNSYLKYSGIRKTVFDDILPNLSKTNLNSKKNVTRCYKISKDKSIQNVSALLIQLIQGSVCKPSLYDLEKYKLQQQSKFSLKEAQQFASMVILYFIEKCSEKHHDEPGSEYRILLENFIQDLLTVLDHPEWPAASFILHLFGVTVMQVIDHQKVDPSFRLVSIDLLGSILTKLKQELSLSKDEISLSIIGSAGGQSSSITSSNSSSTSSTSTSSNSLIKCVCDKPGSNIYTIKCNECGTLFHEDCAPNNNQQSNNKKWCCVSCKVKTQFIDYSNVYCSNLLENDKQEKYKKRPSTKKRSAMDEYDNSDDEENDGGNSSILTLSKLSITEKEIYQQLILNYLEEQSTSKESWLTSSKQFLIASWLDQTVSGVTSKDNLLSRKYFLSQWGIDNQQYQQSSIWSFQLDGDGNLDENRSIDNITTTTATTTTGGTTNFNKSFICNRDDAIKMIRKITISSVSVFQIVNVLLVHLLSILFDPSIKARAKAMKSFTSVIEADPSILADERVQKAIKNRFIDESISVREHTVDLVGKYIAIKPELTWKYIDLICDLISDKGISVRRRVVKTLNEICLNHMQHPKLPSICKVLASRLSDEDSIKELVLKTFQDLWFSERFYENSNDNNDSNNNNHNDNIVGFNNNPEVIKVRQIIEVSKYSVDQDDWFVELIQKMVNRSGGASSITTISAANKKKMDKESIQVMTMSKKICSTLIEMLVNLDERKCKNPQEYQGIFKTLQIFCRVDPSFLIPFVSILHPYLKPDDPNQPIPFDQYSNFNCILYILEHTLPLIPHNDQQFLARVESDLIVLIEKQGTAIVSSSIKCLCVLVDKCSKNYQLLSNQLGKSVWMLKNCTSITKGEILRSLYMVGLFIRYFDFEEYQGGCVNQSLKINIKSSDLINYLITIISRLFTFAQDKDVVSKSLESIGNIIISSPKILGKDVIKDLLSKSFSGTTIEPKIKETVMKLYYDLLEKEMDQVKNLDLVSASGNDIKYNNEDKKKQIKTIKDSTNVAAAIESKPADSIVSMRIDQNSESLVSSIQKYFSSMVKFLVEPDESVRLTSISTVELIIRQGILNPLDSLPFIITLLTDPNRKISELAYNTLISLNQKHGLSLFKRVSESLKLTFKFHKDLNSRSPYNTVTKGISKFYLLFKASKQSRSAFLSCITSNFESIKDYKYSELEYLLFIFEILASLPYGNMDEILIVIRIVDKIVSLNASFLLSEIQSWLNSNIKKRSSTETTQDTTPDSKSSKKLDKSAHKNFLNSMVIVFMLQLKKFLLKTYSITSDKLKSFLEGSGSDKLSLTLTESIIFTDNNYPFSTLPSESDLLSNLSSQKSIFLEFKTLLKDDDKEDFSMALESTTTNGSKKRKQQEPKPQKPKPASSKSNSRKKKPKVVSSSDDDE